MKALALIAVLASGCGLTLGALTPRDTSYYNITRTAPNHPRGVQELHRRETKSATPAVIGSILDFAAGLVVVGGAADYGARSDVITVGTIGLAVIVLDGMMIRSTQTIDTTIEWQPIPPSPITRK
jgi:hypothetical protein